MTSPIAGVRRRWPALLAAAGIAAAAIAGALLTQPAALAGTESRTRAVLASLASAGIAAAVIIPLTARRRYSPRGIAVAATAIALVLGLAAYIAGASIQRQCTVQYDGRAVVIGTDLTELAQKYRQVNPQQPIEELLRDARGDTETVWTRNSIARCRVTMEPATASKIASGAITKGDVLAVARVAGIQAAKQTSNMLPLCHPLLVGSVFVNFRLEEDHVEVETQVDTVDRTGVEMEALHACAVAALTIYDMCKSVDKGMVVGDVALWEKTGGRSGTYRRPGADLDDLDL